MIAGWASRAIALSIVVSCGLAPVHAQDRFANVARVSEEVRIELGAPGMSVAVAIDDELVWSSGFGLADVENDVAARGDTVYRIASISKAFGATAVLQLVDQGKVQLDDPVGNYVPGFPHRVTLRQIMTHTSGIRHYRPGENVSTIRFNTLADAIGIFKNDPLMFPPGTRTLYSTYAYNLLQGVVETVSGMRLDAYLASNIYQRAHLTDTRQEYPEQLVHHRAGAYERKDHELRNAPYVDNSIKWLGGGLISSAEDLIRFNIALNQGRLVKPASLKLMQTAGTLNDGTPIEYSVGWELGTDAQGNQCVDKYGSGTGVSAYLMRIPDQRFAVAVLVNVSHGNIKAFARRIADAVFRSTGPRQAGAPVTR